MSPLARSSVSAEMAVSALQPYERTWRFRLGLVEDGVVPTDERVLKPSRGTPFTAVEGTSWRPE